MAVFMRTGSVGCSRWNATECWNSGTNECLKEGRSPDAQVRFPLLSRKNQTHSQVVSGRDAVTANEDLVGELSGLLMKLIRWRNWPPSADGSCASM